MSPWASLLAVVAASTANPQTAPPTEAKPRPVATSSCPDSDGGPPRAVDNLYKQRVADSVFRRTGFTLGVAIGISGCDTGDFCRGEGYWSRTVELEGERGVLGQRPVIGPSSVLEIGLRPIPYVEAVAFGHFTYHPTRIDQPSFFPEGEPLTLSASGGVAAFVRPLAFTRFDPYLGLGVGYHVYRSRIDYTRSSGLKLRSTEELRRLVIRPSVGLDVFVARNVALGPRLDYDFFVAGQYCNTFAITDVDGTIVDGGGCNDISDFGDFVDPEGDEAEGTLPRFWRVGLNLRAFM